VRDGLGHDDVERRDAVARHHQQPVVADGVDVPNLAGVDVGQAECWSTGHGRASQGAVTVAGGDSGLERIPTASWLVVVSAAGRPGC
jgi:hypothetical protein